MILLSVHDITKHFGPEPVLNGITFDVRKGERLSVVGPNGTGKTTLLRILASREEPDGGSRQLHPSARVGYLEQQPEFTSGRTVWQEALEALRELVALAQEAEELAHRLAEAVDATRAPVRPSATRTAPARRIPPRP
jgi:ATPase subunit of ABC transporter with duplicated ATPase domains